MPREAPTGKAIEWAAAEPSLMRRAVRQGQQLVKGWWGGTAGKPVPVVAPPPAIAPVPAAPAVAAAPVSIEAARQAWGDQLWGSGLCLPGGMEEVLRLAALLPLSSTTTLLLAGRGAVQAGAGVAEARSSYVSAFDDAPWMPGHDALPPAVRRKVEAGAFDPAAPVFRSGYHHHALLLEPFRSGTQPVPMLQAVARGLRSGAQIVLLDLVATPSRAGDAARWLAIEGRSRPPPPESAVPAALGAAGFSINVTEDAGPRQAGAILFAWQNLLGALSPGSLRGNPLATAALVAEAEAWLLRLRLLRTGQLRLRRWHASLTRTPPPAPPATAARGKAWRGSAADRVSQG